MSHLSELETKIGEFSLTIEIVKQFCNEAAAENEDLELLTEIKNNGEGLLIDAVKCDKLIVVEFLIKCGINVNAKDQDGKSSADYAWTNGNYRTLLSLLEADSFFPTGFVLGDDDEDSKKIKEFVENRCKLHNAIKNGDDLKLDLSSKLYLDTDNHSAVYVAVKSRQFKTYAYLKSIGAEFARDEEKLELGKLNDTEKSLLQEAMVYYFPPVPNSHIFYLVSKSRSQKPIVNLSDKLLDYFEKLDEISEISLILQVIQYSDYLDLIFDFEEDEVSKVYPKVLPEHKCRGETLFKLGRIYMAVNSQQRTTEEILGTIAHELTHMAMEILYGNECNPYRKTDEKSVQFFKDFKFRIEKDFPKPVLGHSEALMGAIYNYKPSDHVSELIVRIPQILIQFKDGKKWLKKNIPELLKFYKKNTKKHCKEFVNQSVFLKPKNTVKSINESVGEVLTLRKFNISFKNCPNLLDNEDKPILLCQARSTQLGMLYVLQGIYGKSYTDSYNNFLVVKFKNLTTHENEILKALLSEGTDFLMIEITEKPEIYNVCRSISRVLDAKPYKKVIFVSNEVDYLRKQLDNKEYFLKGLWYRRDFSLGLDCLDEKSRLEILKKRVCFQGKSTLLKNLIQNEELYKFIGPETVELLINGREIDIGRDVYGFSDLEGSYSDILQKINFYSLIREVKKSNNLFIISCDMKDELINFLTKHVRKNLINAEFFNRKSFKEKILKEKIILVNESFEYKNFKDFCRSNSTKKCYFIKAEDLNSLTLIKIYNPGFYVKREVKKIFLEETKMNDLIHRNSSERFIISSRTPFKKSDPNVDWLDEEEARIAFETRKKTGNTVHWFQMEKNAFIWKNSIGSVKNLRDFLEKNKQDDYGPDFDKKSQPGKYLTTEDDLVLQISSKKAVLIADDPGMGKSTTLTALYEAKLIADKHWIIRINLKDHLEITREKIPEKELSTNHIVSFLQEIEPNLKNDLDETLLKLVFKNEFSRCLLLAFDGFDELLDEKDRNRVINLLKFLNNSTPCKIWITSRLHYRTILEDSLETLAIEFHPFDRKMKRTFVENYLKDRLDLIFDENSIVKFFSSEIEIFKEGLLTKMKDIFKDNASKFIGTPLQLNLVMMGSLEYFVKWVEKRPPLDFNYLGSNVIEVYENFVDKKYDVYFKKCNMIEKTRQTRERKNSEKYHKTLAESLVSNTKILKPEEEEQVILLLIGLLQSKNRENFEFIHFTFREFYAAKIFYEYLFKDIPEDKINFIFEKIFSRGEFIMIRYFLNFLLPDKIPERTLLGLKKIFLSNAEIIPLYTTKDSALVLAAEEDNQSLFKFLYSIYIFIPDSSDVTKVLNRTIFQLAEVVIKPPILSIMLEILNGLKLSGWLAFYYKCLIFISGHSVSLHVLDNDNRQSMLLLLKEIQKKCTKDEIHSLFPMDRGDVFWEVLKDTTKSSFKVAEGFLSIIDIAFSKEEQTELLKAGNNYPNAFFYAAKRNVPQMLKFLFQKCEDIMNIENQRLLLLMKTKDDETIFHAASNQSLEMCQLVLDKVKKIFDPKKQSEFLLAENKENRNGLGIAVRNLDLDGVKLIFDEMERISPKETKLGGFLESALLSYRVENVIFALEKAEKVMDHEELRDSLMKNINRTIIITLGQCSRSNINVKITLGKIQLIFEKLDKYFDLEEQWRLITTKDEDGISVLTEVFYKNAEELQNFFLQKFGDFLKPEINLLNHPSIMKNCTADFAVDMVLNNEDCHWLENPNFFDFVLAALKNKETEVFKLVMNEVEKTLSEDSQLKLFNSKDLFLLLGDEDLPSPTLDLFLCKVEKLLTREEIFELLMNKSDVTVLHLAAQKKETDQLKFLLEKLGKILTNEQQRQLLKTAVTNNSVLHAFNKGTKYTLLENIKIILEHAEKIFTEEELRELLLPKSSATTIFHKAVEYGKPDLLKFSLEKFDKILKEDNIRLMTETVESNSILHVAAHTGGHDVLKVLIEYTERNFPIEKQREFFTTENTLKRTPFHEILSPTIGDNLEWLWGKLEKILTEDNWLHLLTAKDKEQYYPLHLAVKNTSPTMLELILDKHEKLLNAEKFSQLFTYNNKYGNILHFSFSNILHQDTVPKLIIEKGKILLKRQEWGAFLKEKDEQGRTALHLAAMMEDFILNSDKIPSMSHSTCLLLKEAKTSMTLDQRREFVFMTDENGQTALHLAAKIGDLERVKLLLQEGKDIFDGKDLRSFVMTRDENNETALDALSKVDDDDFFPRSKKILTRSLLSLFLSELPT